jgi:hypothetical protein
MWMAGSKMTIGSGQEIGMSGLPEGTSPRTWPQVGDLTWTRVKDVPQRKAGCYLTCVTGRITRVMHKKKHRFS